MYVASPAQQAALRIRSAENQTDSMESVHARFVNRFLKFVSNVTASRIGSGGGGGAMKHGYRQWEMDDATDPIAVPTAEGSPDMGAIVRGFRHEVKREPSLIRWREQVIASKVTAAQVEIGPLSPENSWELVEPDTVLQVYSHPPLVLYATKPGKLRPVEPGDPAWEAVTDLADLLTNQEPALIRKLPDD